MSFTKDQITEIIRQSCAAQGIPEVIDDPVIIAAVVNLLAPKFAAGTAKERVRRGALVPSSGPPLDPAQKESP